MTDLTKEKDQQVKEQSISVREAFNREQNKVISENGLDILFVRNYEAIKISAIATYDVVIVDYYDQYKAGKLLKKIRAASLEDIYLIPCFLLANDKDVKKTHERLSDGILESLSIMSHLDEVEKIRKAIEEIRSINTDFVGRQLLLKVIRYLYSRERDLTPVADVSSKMGYTYPFLDANIAESNFLELYEILEAAEKRGFLTPDFHDTVHLCSNCRSGFVNYRDICPKCKTRKHFSEYSIHHFVCGYVGPESDFFQENKMVCPKCHRQLRHIGVDYDKPSQVTECENGHVFQEPDVETFCFSCGDVNTLDSIVDFKVNTYALSATGTATATSGELKEDKEVELEGFVSFPLFKTLIRLESERQKLTKGKVTVSYLSFLFTPKTLKAHIDSFKSFGLEVATLVRNLLNPTEMLTMANDDTFLILTPELSKKETKKRLEGISLKLGEIMRQKFDTSKADRILVESFEMKMDSDSDGILEQINEHVNIL